MDDSGFIEDLLLSEEDATLDVKSEQYPFEGADKEAKSELLKDILAFVNAFRRTDAYILTGVVEVQGGRSEPVGVDEHLDDAKLQEFVNAKTQVPVTFSYRRLNHDGVSIGVIHIPVGQPRPVYTKKTYGKVHSGLVYIRRGSSTGVATPEEIARMGVVGTGFSTRPSAKLLVIDRSLGKPLEGDPVTIDKPTWIDVPPPDEIPDYAPGIGPNISTGLRAVVRQVDPLANRDYYRELATYAQTGLCFPVCLALENSGEVVIHDANLQFELDDSGRIFEFMSSADRPPQPQSSTLLNLPDVANFHSDVIVRREGGRWKVLGNFGKVQPGTSVRLSDDLLVGCRSSLPQTVSIRGSVYGDNVSTPIAVGFGLSFQQAPRRLSIDDIQRLLED